ncbi:hypothetical protein [Herbidospora mongoliensis]|uniref:hypothetical protein n=1 Tax=Herbidospora mongoliensis TaxID=688067 RepID=UPI00082A15FD|nr:hypothetical protein [Herbidospora mongoliensis]
MSKERAIRRAEREAEKARLAEERARREARSARLRDLRGRITAVLPKPVRVARQGGVLARRRRAQNAVMAMLFVLVQVIAWLTLGTVMARLAVLAVSILIVPVLVTVLFDRRS